MKSEQFSKHSQWFLAKKIIKRLNQDGFEAVLAGGCVRDILLHRVPNDIDIATSATPEQVQAKFPTTLDVGKAFGTIVVVDREQQIEVTTFRADGTYSDGRHPDQIEFSDMKNDAARRDFTVNAMFFNIVEEKLIDFFNGHQDLQERKIRCVGSPLHRFQEDKLRMLRAVRFASQLKFEIETKTLEAIQQQAMEIYQVSGERMYNELSKVCSSPYFHKGMSLLNESLLFGAMWPMLKIGKSKSWASYEKYCKHQKQPGFILAFAVLGWLEQEAGNAQNFEKTLASMKCRQSEAQAISRLLKKISLFIENAEFYDLALLINSGLGPSFIELWRVIREGQGLGIQPIESLLTRYFSVSGPKGWLPEVIVKGDELIELGFKPGPKLGQTLKEIHRKQINQLIHTREQALDWARSKLNQ